MRNGRAFGNDTGDFISIYWRNKYFMDFRRSSVPMQWTLCSVKEGNGKETNMQPDTHNRTDEKSLNAKGITTYASFDIDIPQPSDFERQMEIQANLQPSELVGTFSFGI